ncbi:MAG: hypothetical protein AAB268_08470 [Elusimicrobiota bacterium]
MNEDGEARLAKAAMKSLLVSAPESLKADLKRRVRNRKPAPSIWEGRFAFGQSFWAYGAGGAFAAAAIGILILRAVPERRIATEAAKRPARRIEIVVPQTLQDLWADDDGEDNDEI